MSKKKIERICKNCKLFNPEKLQCAITILFEGQRLHLPVDPEDNCFFEEPYFDPIEKKTETFVDSVQQVKFWVEDKEGKKTDKDGTVKMEYPENFFGTEAKNQTEAN